MIVRSAYLEGTVAPADCAEFDKRMSGDVMGLIASYPGIRSVKLRRIEQADPGAPSIYMVFDLRFDSLADMDAALASPTRQAVRQKIGEAMSLFKGRVYHLVFDES